MKFPALLLPLTLVALTTAAAPAQAASRVSLMRCENLENPLGIETPRPRLSWALDSSRRGAAQTSYQLLVASSAEKLREGHGDLWDSGRIHSNRTLYIPYDGTPLDSRRKCFWKVRVWDTHGRATDSPEARWEMGLLDPADWKAKWIARTTDIAITTAPMLRTEFRIDGPIRQARAYVSGLAYYDLYLNGHRVGDHVLDPGFTRYDRRVLYVTHDVTRLLKQGENAAGALLGNGFYNVTTKAAWDFDKAPWRAAPKLLCQIEIDLTDGRRILVGSNSGWKTADSPIVENTIYGGEVYDARREQCGWEQAGFDDSRWTPALLAAPPQGRLTAQSMPPIRAKRTLKPVSVKEPKPGVFVFDFGQNLSGYARLNVSGPSGSSVSMKYAELLKPDGTVDQGNIAVHVHRFGAEQRFQNDLYILKGAGRERWHARFAYHGFQYVEVTGFPGRPKADALTAVFHHSDVPSAGRFACSNPLIDRIWMAARWAYLSNLQGIPTDCPHREKNGWTGDAHLAAEQAMFNYFPAAVNSKWIADLGDEQQPDGRLPGIVPTGGWGYQWGNGPAWDSAFLLIPYYQYVYYGDDGLLKTHYDGMKRYVEYLTGRAKDGIVSIGLNDWAPWKTKTGPAITDTAYYYVNARIVAQTARLLEKMEDAAKYEELAARIKKSFNATFYRPDTGLYDNGSQTALSCALYQGLVDPENRSRVLANLIAKVEAQNGHIDTGILGAKYLLNALLEDDRAGVAYRIVSRKEQPGWGWWIEQGATTLWEEWNGTNSRNHIMYGDVSAWFFKALGGIQPDPAAPGFAHFFIKPHVVGDLTFARAEYDSIRGRIISDWKITGETFHLKLTLPANTSARVSLPVREAGSVREGRKALRRAEGISAVQEEDGRTIFTALSGVYHFSGPLARAQSESEDGPPSGAAP